MLCGTFLKPTLTIAPAEDGLRYVHGWAKKPEVLRDRQGKKNEKHEEKSGVASRDRLRKSLRR